MIFTITNAGLLAANNAQAGGPKINITAFQVGSGVNYQPLITDTALRGTVLHTQTVNGYAVLSANEVEYTLILDETVGNFSFGEIGLFMEDGTLFALSALLEPQAKRKTDASDAGNIVSFEARLVLTQLAATITFPINQMPNARMLELPTVDMLRPPMIADSNAFITLTRDTSGASIVAFKAADIEWSFPSFSQIYAGQVTGNGLGYTSAAVSVVGGGGTGATAGATVTNGAVTNVQRTAWGSGYTTPPSLVITGDGAGAEAVATLTQGVSGLTVVNQGTGYATPPSVVISGGGGTGATGQAVLTGNQVTAINVTNPGRGYTGVPTVTLVGGSGSGATASATVSGVVDTITVAQNTVSSMICAVMNNAAAGVVPGKYILQWLSGSLAGYCRMVVASSNATMNWLAQYPTGTAPVPGDQFKLYQALSSVLTDMRDQLNNGAGSKTPVRCLIAVDVPGVGLGTYDGVSLAEGDRVLRQAQAAANDNGIFRVSAGVWYRDTDFNASDKITPGCLIPVSEGTRWGDSVWQLTTNGPIVLGITQLRFRPSNENWVRRTASSISLINVLALG